MQNTDNKTLEFLIVLFLIINIFFLGIDFLFTIDPSIIIDNLPKQLDKTIAITFKQHQNFKYSYLLLFSILLFTTSPQKISYNNSTTLIIVNLLGLLSIAYFLLAKSIIIYIDFIYIISFLILHYYLFYGISQFQTSKSTKENNIFGLTQFKKDNWSLSLMTTQGLQWIANPFQGIMVIGGAGAGKTASIIDPIILQTIFKGFTVFIYDFKGNPPTLTKTAYNALQMLKKEKKQIAHYSFFKKLLNWKQISKISSLPTPKFFQINFSNHKYTSRVNPISPKYIKSSIHAKSVATTIANALEKKWVKDKDFWAGNAIAILHATIWNLVKHYPSIATIPHVISLILGTKLIDFMKWLSQDNEIAMLMRPTIEAIEQKASGQIAGAMASIQNPLTNLLNKETFWVMSKDEAPLDINDPKNPSILTIANDPDISEGIDAGISVIASLVAAKINQQEKRPCLYCIDELPTIYINKLDKLPATARSNKVITLAGLQLIAQLESGIGGPESKVIMGNLGNQFIGMVNESEFAEKMAKMFGKQEVVSTTYNYNQTNVTRSESLKDKEVIQSREIMGLDLGEFVGKIAQGKPPFFRHKYKLPQFEKHELPVIYKNEEYMNKLINANYALIHKQVNIMINNPSEFKTTPII